VYKMKAGSQRREARVIYVGCRSTSESSESSVCEPVVFLVVPLVNVSAVADRVAIKSPSEALERKFVVRIGVHLDLILPVNEVSVIVGEVNTALRVRLSLVQTAREV